MNKGHLNAVGNDVGNPDPNNIVGQQNHNDDKRRIFVCEDQEVKFLILIKKKTGNLFTTSMEHPFSEDDSGEYEYGRFIAGMIGNSSAHREKNVVAKYLPVLACLC